MSGHQTKSLLQQLKDYRIKIAAIQETKWKENGIMDLKSHLIFYSVRRLGRESLMLPLWWINP
jgi:hypothetical protein